MWCILCVILSHAVTGLALLRRFVLGCLDQKVNKTRRKEGNIIHSQLLKKKRRKQYSFTITEKGRKETNILFNDALNTFYLRLYGIRQATRQWERKPATATTQDKKRNTVGAGVKTRKGFILRRTQHILFTVIWRQTYDKWPFRERERKPAAVTWATLFDWQQGFFYMHHPTDRITHTTAFVTPVVQHWLEREIAQWIHPLTMELHLAPRGEDKCKRKSLHY